MKWNIRQFFSNIKKLPLSWTIVKSVGDNIFQAGWRFGVLLLLIGITFFLIKGLRNETYAIEAFQVPETFNESGINGIVLAKKLVDELNEVEAFISSAKEGPLNNIESNVGQPDLNVEVMGIGLTLNTITYYLRDLVGRENRSIGGELTDIDQTLNLTLRMTGNAPYNYSFFYGESGRSEALNYLLREASKQIIHNLDPYRMAVYHYKKREDKKSLQVIMDILENRPDDSAWAYMAWGNLLNQQNRPEEAVEKFKMAAEYDPNLSLIFNNWGWTEFRLKNYEEAIPVFKKLTKMRTDKGEYWNGLAMCYKYLERFEEADKAHEKAVEVEPTQLYWYRNWANFKKEQGDSLGVEKLYQKIQKKLPFKGANYYLISAYYQNFKGNDQEAFKNLEQAYSVDPFNVDAMTQLVDLYFDQPEGFEKAKSISRKLINLEDGKIGGSPKHFRQRYYNYLAMAEYSLGELDSALVHSQVAIQIDTFIDYPYSTLAETYDLMGDKESFYENIEIALSKGFQLRKFVNLEPYNRYASEKRFQDLLDKYIPIEEESGAGGD